MTRWAWLLAIGCSGGREGTTTPATSDDPACLEGELTYVPAQLSGYQTVPLEADGPVAITQGFQGGFHVDVAGELSPVGSGGVIVYGRLTADDGTAIIDNPVGVQAAWTDYADCVGAFTTARLLTLPEVTSVDALCDLEGEPATFSLILEDVRTGRSVDLEVPVTVEVSLVYETCGP